MSENIKQFESDSTKSLWYVVHTYSGYEKKVQQNIEAAVIRRNMSDTIFELIYSALLTVSPFSHIVS